MADTNSTKAALELSSPPDTGGEPDKETGELVSMLRELSRRWRIYAEQNSPSSNGNDWRESSAICDQAADKLSELSASEGVTADNAFIPSHQVTVPRKNIAREGA